MSFISNTNIFCDTLLNNVTYNSHNIIYDNYDYYDYKYYGDYDCRVTHSQLSDGSCALLYFNGKCSKNVNINCKTMSCYQAIFKLHNNKELIRVLIHKYMVMMQNMLI